MKRSSSYRLAGGKELANLLSTLVNNLNYAAQQKKVRMRGLKILGARDPQARCPRQTRTCTTDDVSCHLGSVPSNLLHLHFSAQNHWKFLYVPFAGEFSFCMKQCYLSFTTPQYQAVDVESIREMLCNNLTYYAYTVSP